MPLKIIPLFLALLVVLGVPFALRPARPGLAPLNQVPRVIIITPHVTQITAEFGEAFSLWHQETYGSPAAVDWRGPLGTSEIITLLTSQYVAALVRGDVAPDGSAKPGAIGYDLMFGGGTFDHGRLKDPKTAQAVITIGGKESTVGVPMSISGGFDQATLDAWYGENAIGAGTLYDPQQFWYGTALSGFGIVFNRDVFRNLGMSDPDAFDDLADPRLAGWIALADPRQSGSVTTTFDAILSNYGWDAGWRLLREMTANTRYFTNASTKPPIDVSMGEAAAGLAIDFYGRGQAQSVMLPGQSAEESRVGYVDPKGTASIDADPVSILRGGPNPDLAKRFVEFCLTPRAQSLWNFHARGSSVPADVQAPGPRQYELRRMPIRRMFYEAPLKDRLIDRVNPFEVASKVKPAGWRSSIGIMMGAFAIDTAAEQRAAWAALQRARADSSFPASVLSEMETAFYAWPTTTVDGAALPFTPDNYRAIRESWKKNQRASEIEYQRFFRAQYQRVIRMERRREITG